MEHNVLVHIRELCEIRGWTIYRLSKESDISYSTLNNLFNRNNTPSIPTLEKICDGFGISLSQFFAGDSPFPQLTDRQRELLNRYSQLPPERRELLEAYLHGLESKSKCSQIQSI
ncbi:MAG: helix-turn-helix transcriptional regulator [Oscillospiraceae bacterium]|nr:helix-turn-helix transcriptional regulator [Oscillospiraceae bacterium]